MRTRITFALLGALILAFVPSVSGAAVRPSFVLVTELPDGTPIAAPGVESSASARGRFVAFTTATALTPGDVNQTQDVYVRDTINDTITRASVGLHDDRRGILGTSSSPSLSADGQLVAFQSWARLRRADEDRLPDVYVRDLRLGTTRLVTRGVSDVSAGIAGDATIAANGRSVVFAYGHADDLVARDTNGEEWDIYQAETHGRRLGIVSVNAAGEEGNGSSFDPSITPDGRSVAFQSYATNLVHNDNDDRADIFVHQINGRTVLASIGPEGQPSEGGAGSPSISADGRVVAFTTNSNWLPKPISGPFDEAAYVRDLAAGTTTVASLDFDGVPRSATNPVLSSDGRYLAFFTRANMVRRETDLLSGDDEFGPPDDVFVRDLVRDRIHWVSRNDLGGAPYSCAPNRQNCESAVAPSFSADGRTLTFYWRGSNAINGPPVGEGIYLFGPLPR